MKYIIPVPVKAVHGEQRFIVEADSEEQALEIWKRTGGTLHSEEIEVTDLDDDAVVLSDIYEFDE